MHTQRGLVAPAATTDARTPYADVEEAAERTYAMVQRQAHAVVSTLTVADPQQWLFAERNRYVRDGVCDPWAEQMLRRAGLWPDPH